MCDEKEYYIVDTHAHIYEDVFNDDIDHVIDRFDAAGVRRIIMPTTSLEDVPHALNLQDKYQHLFSVMVGIHPDSVTANYNKQIEGIIELLQKHKFIGIGEIGLDYYKSQTPLENQKVMFAEQLSIARGSGLPVSIHVRNAFDDCYNILKKYQNGNIKGIIHCFSGSIYEAEKYTDLGFKLGIGGIVTFKNSTLPSILKKISLHNIVLETDSPFLAPEPHRGRRNEPSFLIDIIQKLVAIYKLSDEEIVKRTFQNSCDVFNFNLA